MIAENAADSSAVRASYFIDPEGVIQALIWYPMNVGRSVEEMLRLLAALQRTAKDDVMTPEGWQPGGELLLPPSQGVSAALELESPSWFYRTRKDA